MTAHIFVDEAKTRGYLIAAAVVFPGDLTVARKAVNALVMQGQKRLHFHKESDARRRQILTEMSRLDVEVLLYDGSSQPAAASA